MRGHKSRKFPEIYQFCTSFIFSTSHASCPDEAPCDPDPGSVPHKQTVPVSRL